MDSTAAYRLRMRRLILWHSYFLLASLLFMLFQLHAQALRVAISADDYPPFYYSSVSYLQDPIVLLCAAPCQMQFSGDLASLAHQPVAVVRDFSYGPLLDQVEVYFAFSRQSKVTPELVARFDQALERYKSSTAYQALLQHYQLLPP